MATINWMTLTITDDGVSGPKLHVSLELAVPGVVVKPELVETIPAEVLTVLQPVLTKLRAAVTEKVRNALVLS